MHGFFNGFFQSVAEFPQLFSVHLGCIYRLVDDDFYFGIFLYFSRLLIHLVASVYGYRDYRGSGLGGQLKASRLESGHFSASASRTLGKNYQRVSVLDHVSSLAYGLE